MEDKKTRRGLVIVLVTALLATISIIAVLTKIVKDFSAKLNTADGEDYIPDWSDEDSFDIDLSENLAPAVEEEEENL
ncbi:MAG: hypothetical protein IJC25_07280 [Clostridia bacterium]|nr:hypothetical protein [Clostridia bacterium]